MVNESAHEALLRMVERQVEAREPGRQPRLGHGHADGAGDALAQQAGGDLDPRVLFDLRVPGADRTQLAKALHRLQRHMGIA